MPNACFFPTGEIILLMGFLEDKKRARIFYKYLSIIYDTINPLFWTVSMRETALDLFNITPTDMILDVGCGTGFGTEGLLNRTKNIYGLDQSIHQLNKAHKKFSTLHPLPLCLGDAENLPFSDDTFDAAWSSGSIEYWPNPIETLSEIRRTVKPGGKVLIVGPNKPKGILARTLATSLMLFYNQSEADHLFTSAGFENIKHIILKAHIGSPPAIVTLATVPSSKK